MHEKERFQREIMVMVDTCGMFFLNNTRAKNAS